MDSMKSFLGSLGQRLKHAGLLGMPLFLLACASSPANQAGMAEPATPDADTEVSAPASEEPAVEKAETYLPFSPELMYYILSAEVAGQRGEVGIAVDLYDRAAEMVESPELAKRSAQVATVSRDRERINRALSRWIEVEPDNADAYMMQAPFRVLSEDYDGAVQSINKALMLEPAKKKEFLTRISENLVEVAKPEQALSLIQQLDAYQQNDPEAHYAYARLAFFYKHYETALEEIEPLIQTQPSNEDFLVLKADTLQRMGRSDEALKLVAKAAKRDEASHDLRFTYGKLLGENGESDKARAVFESLQAEDPENRDVLFALGLLALEEKDGKLAKSYFSQLLKIGDPSYQAAYFMGLAEEMNGNIDAALVWFASVPTHSSRFEIAQNNYIKLLVERGDLDKAREHLAQLRKEMPQQALQYYLFEASLLRENGQNQAAFDLLTDAMKQYPQNEDLHYSRAMIAESLNKLDVLESDLRWILEKDPNNAQALNALGYTLTDRTDRHQEALEMITRALEIKPGDPFYLDSLGWVYYRLGKLDEAEKYLREAVEAQSDVEFIAHLGEVLWVQGKQQEAKQVWQQGLEQDADNRLLLETMRRYGL